MSWRIAHVTATFPPYRGGTGNVCFHNARELARRGHEVHVFTAAIPGAPAYEERDGVTIHRFRPLARVGNARILPGLLPALRGFDLIHLHYPFFGGELATLAAKLYRTPLVITYHQDVLLDGLAGLVEKSLRRTVGWLTFRGAARLLFTSDDYGRASYVRPMLFGREHVLGELPNSVDVTRFRPDGVGPNLRTRHNVEPDDRIALLVAGLDRAHYFKGVEIFLAALARLPATVKGLIVGDGDLRERYMHRAVELRIAARVTFAGRVPDEELPDYYRLADVGVLPSVTMGEAFGLVLVESLACGTPVIASDLPGVRTVVSHGVDGLLVRPNDARALATAIENILRDEPRRREMGYAGRVKAVARYSWQHIGDHLETIYREVLAARPAPALQLRDEL